MGVVAHTFDLDDGEEPPEGLTFSVTGTHRSTKEPFTETFTTVPELPAAALEDVSATVVIRDGEAYYQRGEVLALVRLSIAPDERDRWDALVRDPDRLVKLSKLVEIMLWLVGALTDRPTGPLPNSQPGSAGTENGSGAHSSPQATPPQTSDDSPQGTGSTSP